MEKLGCGILDKHQGSATLLKIEGNSAKLFMMAFITVLQDVYFME
jgi:hypothetical protein